MGVCDLLASSPDSPKYPGLVLFTHVLAKGVELGATVGLGLGVLLGTVDYAQKKRSPLIRTLEFVEIGVSLGCLAGAIMVLGKAATNDTMNAEGIQERAYRLTHSVPGVKHKMDVRFLGGGVLGAFLCGYVLPERWMRMSWLDRVTRGFCLGGALSVLPMSVRVMNKMARKQLEMA